jgi:hypothetical protein
VQDQSDLGDPVDVDDFLPVLIARGDEPVISRTVRPQAEALERLVRERLAGSSASAPRLRELTDLVRPLQAG